MAAKAATLAKPPGRLEFWAVFVAAVALTGWSIAMALEACVGTLNVADFGQFAEPNWSRSYSKIVYLFTPVLLQFIGLLYLTIHFLHERIRDHMSDGSSVRRFRLFLLLLLIILCLCDTHMRSSHALRPTDGYIVNYGYAKK